MLDSILRVGGPMPAAKLGIRTVAFLMDFTLLLVLSGLVIKMALPGAYPGASQELSSWLTETWAVAQVSAEQSTPFWEITQPQMSPYVMEAISFAWETTLLICWAYFAIGEALFKGSSLGKYACRLRTISTVTLQPPGFLVGIVRGGTKTMAIFLFMPICFALNLLALLFNKRSQLGHDLFSRTAVIDEKSVNPQSHL